MMPEPEDWNVFGTGSPVVRPLHAGTGILMAIMAGVETGRLEYIWSGKPDSEAFTC